MSASATRLSQGDTALHRIEVRTSAFHRYMSLPCLPQLLGGIDSAEGSGEGKLMTPCVASFRHWLEAVRNQKQMRSKEC